MRISAELRDHEAAGSLAEELPYWGWLEDGRTCLTRTGELIAAGRLAPAVVDGRSPEQIDRVMGRWQRLLSGLDADTRLYFYMLLRPSAPAATDDESSGIVAVSQRKRRAFLSGRVQRLEAYLVWSLDPRLRTVADGPTSGSASRLMQWWKRRRASAPTYLGSEIEVVAARFRALVDAGRALLRLEELERRTRSLRALPVAQSYRDPNATAESSEADRPGTGDAADADVAVLENTVQAALASFEQSLGALEGELAAEQLLLGSPGIAAATAPVAGPQASLRAPGTAEPGRSIQPADPPGWERIHEGSFLEAVLLTQLTGDFPGPVLATVSVPFYSADRQRVLIPRGTRVVGTAQAVQDQDQSRLAVAFHRLLLPDGSWIDLEFTGLNQAGEGALRDEVDRHHYSTFAAAGAVGVVSGLALASGSPFGLRAGVGQGLGQSATSVLDRFLNRLPTITIRAGHRLRVWFTSDVLVPGTGTRQ